MQIEIKTKTPPFFKEHTIPVGLLPSNDAAQACFYFYVLCQKQKENVGKSIDDQVLCDDELWMDTHYEQTKKSVAFIYSLKSPTEMNKFWDKVILETTRVGMPMPAYEYVKL